MLVIFMTTILLGKLSGYEAKILIKNSVSGVNTLCNTIVLASATILALLLALLGISSNSSSKLKKDHYKYVLDIAKLDTIVFIASIMAFLIFNLPITESDNVPANWFNFIYYATLTIASVLSAALIVVVLMLYNTVANIIKIVGWELKEHPWMESEEEEKKNFER